MRESRIYDHTEKVGGRTKERTVGWVRPRPEGAFTGSKGRVRGTITRARNGECRVVLQLLLYGVKQRPRHGTVEVGGVEYRERVSFDLDLDYQSIGQYTLR